ncbi:hypothetical protein BBP40_004244 [Aspergillus hancockii]|nr:hypothetical protein BBP40_004244 [Aspergillus hancockii]
MSVRSTIRFRLALENRYLGLRRAVPSLAQLRAADPDGKYPKIQETIRNYKEPAWIDDYKEPIDDLRNKEVNDYYYRKRLERAGQPLVSDQFQYLFWAAADPGLAGHVSLVDKTDSVDWETTIHSSPSDAWKLKYDTPYELQKPGWGNNVLLATPSISGYYHKIFLASGDRSYLDSYKHWKVDGVVPSPRFSSHFRFQKDTDGGSKFLKHGDEVNVEITTPDPEYGTTDRPRAKVSKMLKHSLGGEEWTGELNLEPLTFKFEVLPRE